MLLPIINWALSFFQLTKVKWLRTLFVLTEVLLTAVTLLAVIMVLLKYHLIINRIDLLTLSFYFILFMVQVYYIRNYSKISYVFLTSVLTLLLTLFTYAIAYDLVSTMPIHWYYLAHLLVLLGWDHNEAIGILRKQTWINKIQIFESILPRKNISTYVLSSVASFCYSSLNLCVLLSCKTKTTGIPEWVAFSLTILILVLTGVTSFSLLVKHENIGDVQFPGSLLIHYIVQGYKRCYNLISGNVQINTKPKFTLRTLLFALLLIIDALGSTAFAVTIPLEASSSPSSPVGEGNVPSATRQTFSSIGSEVAQGVQQGLRDIPRVTTSTAGAAGVLGAAGAIGTSVYTAVTGTEDAAGPSAQVEEPQQARIRELEGQVKGLETENTHLKKALQNEQNKTFFQRYFKCFGANSSND